MTVQHITKSVVSLIGPKEAQVLLDRSHGGQRNISVDWVRVLADRIRRGVWDQNAGFVCVDEGGRLTDGQHRCSAIVAAGIAVPVVVIQTPWSAYRDDTRRRSLSDRHGVSNRVAAIARLAGRQVGIQDGDAALSVFESPIARYKIDTAAHATPWGCSAAGVGALAASLSGHDGAGCIDNLCKAMPTNSKQRALIVRASRNAIATTGNGQTDTALAVFCAAIDSRATLDAMRSSLMSVSPERFNNKKEAK